MTKFYETKILIDILTKKEYRVKFKRLLKPCFRRFIKTFLFRNGVGDD